MKKLLYSLTCLLLLVCCSCSSGHKRAADHYMQSMANRDYEKASYYCGVSKDLTSKQLMITMILEKYGDNIRSFTIKSDSIFPDKQNAVVMMDIFYTNNTKDENVPIYTEKMGDRWIVSPFK